MEDSWANSLKKELDKAFGIPIREVVESIAYSSRYNTLGSRGDLIDTSYVSNLVGVSGGWELNPPEDPNPTYLELFLWVEE